MEGLKHGEAVWGGIDCITSSGLNGEHQSWELGGAGSTFPVWGCTPVCVYRYCLDSAHMLTQAVLTLFPAPALQWTENLLDETLVLRGSQV